MNFRVPRVPVPFGVLGVPRVPVPFGVLRVPRVPVQFTMIYLKNKFWGA